MVRKNKNERNMKKKKFSDTCNNVEKRNSLEKRLINGSLIYGNSIPQQTYIFSN